MCEIERRKFKRLPLKLEISCRKVDSTTEKFQTGRTVNVSPGGLYFETLNDTFETGNLLKVELTIPPTEGLLEFGGRISGLAKILRTHDHLDSPESIETASGRYGVAVEFCQSPKLAT